MSEFIMPDPVGDNNIDQRLIRKDQMDDAIDTFDPMSQSFTDMPTWAIYSLAAALGIIVGTLLFI